MVVMIMLLLRILIVLSMVLELILRLVVGLKRWKLLQVGLILMVLHSGTLVLHLELISGF